MRDPEAFLAPIDDMNTCGEDLEYEAEFVALEGASRPSEERVIGDTVIPAEDPDYGDIVQQAQALLARTHDLRVASILAHAVLYTDGMSGFSAVLHYMHGCLDRFWQDVHPQLDPEDGDATMRVNAVLSLVDRDGVLNALRRSVLIESRAFGAFSLRDLEIASGDLVVGDEASADAQTITAAFMDVSRDDLAHLMTQTDAALGNVQAISAVFDAHLGADGPDLEPLCRMLSEIRRRVLSLAPADLTTPDDTDAVSDPVGDISHTALSDGGAATPAGEGLTPAQVSQPNAAITTPAEVKAALDRIMTYYQTYEPSSPLPLLLARAKRLVSADFLTIIRDLAPEGLENVHRVGGTEPYEGDEGTYD